MSCCSSLETQTGGAARCFRIDPSLVPHIGRLGKKQIVAPKDLSAEEWLEGATKMDGQFSGEHVKWAPETTKAKGEK